MPKSGFQHYNFTYELYKAILLKNFHAPLPIQKKALPVIL
jgi:superfamily II DNA/RNA helicase